MTRVTVDDTDIKRLSSIPETNQEGPLPDIQEIVSAIDQGLYQWWGYSQLNLGKRELQPYDPWHPYKNVDAVNQAYVAMLTMPHCWERLCCLLEGLSTAATRDLVYKLLGQRDSRERSWYTCKRQPGVLSFLIPTDYTQGDKDPLYPRVQPRNSKANGSLGLIGVHKAFRIAVLSDLNKALQPTGYKVIEVDFISCHLAILAGLRLGTPALSNLLKSGGNVWKTMVGSLSTKHQKEFGFVFLKAAAKKLSYKCLQGGRVDSPEKILRTLKDDEKRVGQSLRAVSEDFARNKLLLEFDILNTRIMERLRTYGRVRVFTPMHHTPLELVRRPQRKAEIANPCRLASQVVVGAEMLQLLALLETMRDLRVSWLPISLHHDGAALLVREATFTEDKVRVEERLLSKLKLTGIAPLGLEFTEYNQTPIVPSTVEERGEHRII